MPDREAVTGTPRWVKVFGLSAVVIAGLVAILLLLGGGHGPSRHTAPSGSTGHTPPVQHQAP
jgi:hypothetical protein